MNIIEIIEKKRDGDILNNSEIEFFISAYVNNEIMDYQMSALLMAICIRGMNMDEIFALTSAMINSGDILDLNCIKGIKVDKHSTGGVGDKTSLIIGPIMAASGASFAKMSGRGLSYTGGTLDKLEAIEGFHVFLSNDDFVNQVNTIGLSIIGQSETLVPADKKLYALRDVCGCVPSIPLIASSIMSKKIAAGCDVILLDVKYGDGAFMKNPIEAEALAHTMIEIGTHFNKIVKAEITSMEQPLGCTIGNSLEVIEAINTLNGKGPKDLTYICTHSSAQLLMMAKLVKNEEEAYALIHKVINNGKAFDKFKQMIVYQGGNINYLNLMKQSKLIIEIKSENKGYISRIKTKKLGLLACELGAGRKVKTDSIIHEVGIVLNKKYNDHVNVGDIICYVHTNNRLDLNFINAIKDCFKFSDFKQEEPLLIYKII